VAEAGNAIDPALTAIPPVIEAFPKTSLPVMVPTSADESSTVDADADPALPNEKAPEAAWGTRSTVFEAPPTVPPDRSILSAVRVTVAAVVPMAPALWVKVWSAPVTVRATPVGPVTAWLTVRFPDDETVTDPVDDVRAPEVAKVPVLTRLTTPPVAEAWAWTFPEFESQMSPAELVAERRVVAEVTTGDPEAPTEVAPEEPRTTDAAERVPEVETTAPVALRVMLPAPATVTFPLMVRFWDAPAASIRRAPPETSERDTEAVPTVIAPADWRNRSPETEFAAERVPAGTAITTGLGPEIRPMPVAADRERFPTVAVKVPAERVTAPVVTRPKSLAAVRSAPTEIPPVVF